MMGHRMHFIDRTDEVRRKVYRAKDMTLAHMAQDIEIGIKVTAGTPKKQGHMKGDVRHFKVGDLRYRVESPKEYSAVQEAGIRLSGKGAPTRKFTNYSLAGTSAGWFKRAVSKVADKFDHYVQSNRRAVGL